MLNQHAQALGRLNAGVKKNMTKAALRQRKEAARSSGKKRKGKKRATESVSPEINKNKVSPKPLTQTETLTLMCKHGKEH